MALIHTSLFVQQIIDLIKTDHPLDTGALSLKVVQPGQLEKFTTSGQELKSMLPVVLISPDDVQDVEFENTTAEAFTFLYSFRILYIDNYTTLKDKTDKTDTLAFVFQQAVDRFTAPEANVQVLFSQVDTVEYIPEEEGVITTIHDDLWASVITISIHTLTQKV